MKQGQIEVAQRLVGVMDDETIAQMSDLTLEELRQIGLSR